MAKGTIEQRAMIASGFAVPYPFDIAFAPHFVPIEVALLPSHIMQIAASDNERFRAGAEKYAAYLETPEGRLRVDLAFATLLEFLPRTNATLRVLDVGGGTGAMAVRLALSGMHVTLLDSSREMLELAERSAQKAGVSELVSLKQGDAMQLAAGISSRSFDLILCHNVLEYIADPVAVLTDAVAALRDASSILSVLVRNQSGEVLKAAIQEGDLCAAEHTLTAECANESLYGGKVRLFSAERLTAMLESASLAAFASRGVRVSADYLPAKISRNDEYNRILDLESKLGRRPEFAAVARYSHVIARRANSTTDIP